MSQNKSVSKKQGFTLIELIIVIIILGILAITALPKFINTSSNARIAVISNLRATIDNQIEIIILKSKIPGNTIMMPNGQYWLDMNNNGIIDGDSNGDQNTVEGKDGADILLLNNSKIDNYQISKIIDVSDAIEFSLGPYNHQVYIGFDMLGNDDIKGGNCRVYYDQNSVRMVTTGC